MERRKVAGWKVPAPTSISSGWSTTQPCSAQYCCRASIRPWKVVASGVDPEAEVDEGVESVCDGFDERVIAEAPLAMNSQGVKYTITGTWVIGAAAAPRARFT